MQLSSLISTVMSELPGVTVPVVKAVLLRAFKQLCQEGNAWKIPFTVSIVAGQKTYALVLPIHDTEIVRVFNQSESNFINLRVDQVNNGVLELDEAPQKDDGLTLNLIIKPVNFDVELPSINEEWVLSGALYLAKKMKGTPWEDSNSALYYGREFESAKGQCKRIALHGGDGSSIRIKPRRF